MSLLLPAERYLINLESEISPEYVFIFVPKNLALAGLRLLTGQDFGYDARKWRAWLEANDRIPIAAEPLCGPVGINADNAIGRVLSDDAS